jgi:signal transduction histidine kinase/CheY-like chemotaxis protein
MAYAIYGKAKVYYFLNEFEKSEELFLKALEIHQKMGENTGICMTFNKLAELYFKIKHFQKALDIALKGLQLSANLNLAMSTIKLNKIISLIYSELGDFEKAYHYLQQHLKEKEVVINIQTLKVIENYEMITKMNSLKKEAELQKEKQEILENKNRDEIEAYRQKQEFLSIMSHEIRTPLNAITTTISILDDNVLEEGKKMLNNLKFASNNLINIVNDVLDFTKLDTNNAKIVSCSTNLDLLCQNVTEVYLRQAREKNVELEYTTNVPKENNYLIDQTKLTQVLNNLISNAIKFTDKGKVTLNIDLTNKNGKIDKVLFSVIDTGEGISRRDLNNIFDSFSQLKPYLTRKQGGTGLGLAIVKKLVELFGGKIYVKSKIGEGSTFYFELPFEKTEILQYSVATSYDKLIGKRILIVDDTKMNAILLMKLLSKWKLVSEYVESGSQALNKVEQSEYDFILMDIHMPEMNGFEVSEKIKNGNNLNKSTPIFAVTADVLADTEENFSKLFNGIIFKPFEIEKLYQTLVNASNEVVIK